MSFGDLLQRAWFSILSPREAAQAVLALDWPRGLRRQALFLAVLLSSLVFAVADMLDGEVATVPMFGINTSLALVLGMAEFFVMAGGAWLAAFLGRLAGGNGDFDGAIILAAWLQFVTLVVQLAQLLVMFVAPPLQALIDIAAFILSFWLVTNFIAALHGFQSLALVLLSILATLFGFGMILAMVLAAFGIEIAIGE